MEKTTKGKVEIKTKAEMKKHCLIIDDSDIDTLILRHRLKLELKELEIQTFESVSSGWNYLEMQCAPQEFPDVIILDKDMPMFDGFKFLEKYRQSEYPKKFPDTKVVMMSSYFFYGERQKAIAYDFVTSCFTKPGTDREISILTNLFITV